MRDRDLYAQILGIGSPWAVREVKLDPSNQEVVVLVDSRDAKVLLCPECSKPCGRYDHRERRWRHLDTCQYRTILVAEVPRVNCPDHGVSQVTLPWAEPGSRFTALFEALAIDWLKEASASAVGRLLRLSWDEVDGIMQRAVRRGLARRPPLKVSRIGVDETSYQKRHEYVTVVTDQITSDVVYVADDKKKESLEQFYLSLDQETLEGIEVVAMDMWKPYITVTTKHVPDAKKKIAFDKFHVAKMLGDAVDKVRRQEHRELMQEGDGSLKGSKYLWIQNPENMSSARWNGVFRSLREMSLKTARAWGIKELAMTLWSYSTRGWAKRAWSKWYSWAIRSRLAPIKRAARTIKEHIAGIINAIVLRATNATAESLNAKIQRVKRRACGYRNRERFRAAIYFHLGGLDLYPATHTKP